METDPPKVYGKLSFASPDWTPGTPMTEKEKAGYKLKETALSPGLVALTPIPEEASLFKHGVELLGTIHI